jgi:methionyl-tRNA synthetase
MADEFGADAFRYFLLREVPFGQDGDFSKPAMVTSINSDLANGIGNLLSRTLTMIERFAGGKIPASGSPVLAELEEKIAATAAKLPDTLERGFVSLAFRDNLQAIWELVGLCDEYIDKSAPWTLAKKPEDAPKLNTVLNTATRALRLLSVLMYPYMPQISVQALTQLGLTFDFSKPVPAESYAWETSLVGAKIQKGTGLFPRVIQPASGELAISGQEAKLSISKGGQPVSDSDTSPHSTNKADTPAAAVPTPPLPAQITIDEFMKIQLKTAKVISAERVPKSEKLLKLQVSLGSEQRQIVAGIGKKYEPEALIGKTIVIVSNLKPAKLMGIESQGMVLAAGDSEVRGLATFLEDVEPGTKVK